MIKTASIILSSCLLTVASSYASAEVSSAPAWCKTSTITGTLKKGTAPHPNGSKVIFHYLELKQPITIAAVECEGVKMAKETTKEVQVKEDAKVLGAVHSSRFVFTFWNLDVTHGSANVERYTMVSDR